MTLMEKQLVGSLFGLGQPRADIPAARPLPRGPARPRRARHPHVLARRRQPRLRGDARRRETSAASSLRLIDDLPARPARRDEGGASARPSRVHVPVVVGQLPSVDGSMSQSANNDMISLMSLGVAVSLPPSSMSGRRGTRLVLGEPEHALVQGDDLIADGAVHRDGRVTAGQRGARSSPGAVVSWAVRVVDREAALLQRVGVQRVGGGRLSSESIAARTRRPSRR